MRKSLKIAGIIVIILILFRGWIFRSTIHYREIGKREEILITNQELLNVIDSNSTNKKIGFEEIIEIANSITINELSFTGNKASNNPNELIKTKQANCIGYSSMFNSIANYLIKKNQLEQKVVAIHKIGRLDFLGIDLHQFFSNPFFQDHDFNVIKNLETGRSISIDPSISDYFWIDRVSSNSE